MERRSARPRRANTDALTPASRTRRLLRRRPGIWSRCRDSANGIMGSWRRPKRRSVRAVVARRSRWMASARSAGPTRAMTVAHLACPCIWLPSPTVMATKPTHSGGGLSAPSSAAACFSASNPRPNSLVRKRGRQGNLGHRSPDFHSASVTQAGHSGGRPSRQAFHPLAPSRSQPAARPWRGIANRRDLAVRPTCLLGRRRAVCAGWSRAAAPRLRLDGGRCSAASGVPGLASRRARR